MTETTDRYRQRPIEVEAVQWTGSNAEALRAFAGIDFDTIDPADRIDPDDDAQLLVEASHWVGIRPGDWVLKFEGYFMAKSDVPFRAVWEPAAETQAVGVEALARLLNGADVHIHNGHHPGWDSLAESGEEQYLGMARWLLKRLHVAEREPAAPAAVAADRAALAAEAAIERVRSVLESEAVVGRSALDYRGLITSALMADQAPASDPSRMAGEAQQPETQPTGWHLTPQTLDLFVRALVNEVDYDIHKGYECGEEDGEDHYPELVAEAAEMLDAITNEQPGAEAQQPKEAENPRTVCVCGHTRAEHLTVSGRLLCDVCVPDSTDNLVCKEFEAL